MKKRDSEEQITRAIKDNESGVKVDDICHPMGFSTGTFYYWRSIYAGLEVNEAKRLRELESENNKLKKLLAEKLIEKEVYPSKKSLTNKFRLSRILDAQDFY